MQIVRNILVGLAILFLSWNISRGHDVSSDVRMMVAARTNVSPRMDGWLNDSCWENAKSTSDFILREPEEGMSEGRPPGLIPAREPGG